MHKCHEDTERELLPLLLRGQLAPADAGRLEAHIAACPACAEEVALVERSQGLFDAATPRVHVSAIVAKLPAPPPRALTVLRGSPLGRGGRAVVPRHLWAAAASLTLVATLSFAMLRDRVFGPQTPAGLVSDAAMPTQVASGAPVLASGHESATLLGSAELSDLGASELEALLADLEAFEATIAAEPMAMLRAVVPTPEGL
jgi:anti-sigma factor RsiW